MMRLGYNTKGTESVFEAMLEKAIKDRTTPGFRYTEVGIAEGTTLASVTEKLKEVIPDVPRQSVGVDIAGGLYFIPERFLLMVPGFSLELSNHPFIENSFLNDIRVILLKLDKEVIEPRHRCINFALIDGCHGAACVTRDFLAIEPGIAHNGIVAFHDACLEDQGHGFQPHCKEPINVLKALHRLGLYTDSRPGWRWVGEVRGDKSREGNGFMFFQRTQI